MGTATTLPDSEVVASPIQRPRFALFRSLWRWFRAGVRTLIGIAAILMMLAICVSIPVLYFNAFGYLLLVGRAIAKTGRIRDAFPGIDEAARLGAFACGAVLFLAPLWLLRDFLDDARLIEPSSPSVSRLESITGVLAIFISTHLIISIIRGGRPGDLLHPVRNIGWLTKNVLRPGWYYERLSVFFRWLQGLALGEMLSLGVRGYLGSMLWLVLPSLILSFAPWNGFAGLVGGILVGLVAISLPILQTRFAYEDRFGVFTEWRDVVRLRARAPLAWLMATLFWLLLSVVYYSLLVEEFPPELTWVPGLFFVVAVLPGRVLAGWAMSRSLKRSSPARWFIRWPIFALTLALGFGYAFLLAYSPYVAFRGRWMFFEQHAFLFPILN